MVCRHRNWPDKDLGRATVNPGLDSGEISEHLAARAECFNFGRELGVGPSERVKELLQTLVRQEVGRYEGNRFDVIELEFES
jgi:hypothetical protein